MNDMNNFNYLGKKKEIIFSIVKISRDAKNLLKINNKSKTGNKYKHNSNLEEGDSSDQPYSLFKICKLVFEFIKKAEVTTGNKVTDHIINVLKPKRNDDQLKNIQRRVYDSINVMSAAGLIKKDNKEIKYLKKESEKNNPIIELEEEISDEYVKEKMEQLEEKKKNLIKRYLKLEFRQKYQKLNEIQKKSQKNFIFPFDLIFYNCTPQTKIVQNEDLSRAMLMSSHEIIHYSPYDIMKGLLSLDILSKLNDNSNGPNENKSKQIMSTPKKNLNGESLLENMNNHNMKSNKRINDKDKELEERKNNKDLKKIMSNVFCNNFNNFTPIKTKINNKDKDSFLVLNYIKNSKDFKDELMLKKNDKKEKNDSNIKANSKSLNGNKFRKNSDFSNVSNYDDDENIIIWQQTKLLNKIK